MFHGGFEYALAAKLSMKKPHVVRVPELADGFCVPVCPAKQRGALLGCDTCRLISFTYHASLNYEGWQSPY